MILKATDFGETLEGDVAKDGHDEEGLDEMRYELGLEYVAERNPVEETQERLERHRNQARILRIRLEERSETNKLNKIFRELCSRVKKVTIIKMHS